MFNARTRIELPSPLKPRQIGPVALLDPTPIIEATSAKPGLKLKGMLKWSMAHKPSHLTSSLRSGLPVWMAYQAIQRGWPLTLVVAPNQISRSPSDRQPILLELWGLAQERIVTASFEERDDYVRQCAPILTIDHILTNTVPE